ncbi:MAG: class II aldolase/adducin family protein [Chloroflexi bacterium]|nr:class II aldolase/adducin family protein [Chloroflexota bacterium]
MTTSETSPEQAVTAGGSADEQQLRERVTTASRVLYRLGLTDYMGHASARVPGSGRILIKPRHSQKMRAMNELTPERVIVVDIDGNLLEGDEPPPSEKVIHTEIFRARPDVGGVVHTHQTLATVFGIVGKPILPILHVEAPLVAAPIPIYPSAEMVITREDGAELARVLGDNPVAHLQGHGIVTVGRTVEEATIAAIHLERLARANLLAAQLGGDPKVIPPDVVERLRGPMVGWEVRWAYYAGLLDDPDAPANW